MPHRFIVSPKGNQYNNSKQIGDVELIINTSIEEAENVNRNGIVIALPLDYKGEIEVGDEVIVHHNIFRITYNDKGIPRQSDFHIKDNLFYIDKDLIYLFIRNGKKMAVDNHVFIKPIKENDKWFGEIEKERIGIVKFANKTLISEGINEGDKIGFFKDCEYPFEIDNEKLYLMKNHRILVKL